MATALTTAELGQHLAKGTAISGHFSRPTPLAMSRLVQHALMIMAILSLNQGGTAGSALFFVVLSLMVLYSPSSAFKAIAICYLGLMINTAFVPKTLVWTPGRLVLPLLAFCRFSVDLAAMRTSLFGSRAYVAFFAYVIVMAICSILSGWYTNIALLKLANFWAVLSAILAGLVVLRAVRVDLTEWFVSLILATALVGLLSIATGVQANYYNQQEGSRLFNGAFLHPNCHSLYASQFVTYLASMMIMGKYRNLWLAAPLIAIWCVFMIMSQSRTSVVATMAGLLVLFLFAQPRRNRTGWRVRLNLSRATIFFVLVLVIASTFVMDAARGGAVRRSIVAFFNKGGNVESTAIDATQVISSRVALIEFSWRTFLESPVYGIGFQVSKSQSFVRNATWLTAPAEKGFLPTAILEEGGVLGATAFVAFLLAYIAELWRQRSIPALSVFVTLMTCNMTEVSLFSPGGAGSFGWLMVGAALILSDHCWRPPPPALAGGRCAPRADSA